MAPSVTSPKPVATTTQRLPVIDADVHPSMLPSDPPMAKYLSKRWRDYLSTVGLRNVATERTIPPQRQFTHRSDTIDESGRPAVVPSFTRHQLLDEFDMSGAILNGGGTTLSKGGMNFPEQLGFELCRAYNDAYKDMWLAADPRFYSSIHIPVEHPDMAVKEIARCREAELGDRHAQVLVEPRTEYPIGNPKYWPIFEACEHYGLPLAFHVAPGRRMTACGGINYYFEWHVGFSLRNFTLTPSLIFEGVFDRFPNLRIVLVEQSWSWVIPFAWRLDTSWHLLRDEVAHLRRKPSEYLRSNFWFTTQPMEEPEHVEEYRSLLRLFEETVGPTHLMYSSDYPHWDFDSPYESVPQALPIEQRRRILGQNASSLYGIPLRDGTGIDAAAVDVAV